MKIELNEQEATALVEMLTMTGYLLTQVSDNALAKAEQMHELIQKIYRQAQAEHLPDGFDTDEESQMIFPNAELMSGAEDSPLYLLKHYNEYAAADVLSQQLGLRDAAKAHGLPEEKIGEEFDSRFIDAFIENQNKYLEEFAENGFENVRVTRLQLI
ncbi:MAG: hypothetical protein CR974_02890 [Gammaproteobacteria bacterium]|nr:MAG: hypothetical protein CR974_02890 [Gammaproteobacteria bacterium]